MDKQPEIKKPNFRNVALLLDDHAMLKQLAETDQRSMTRQLSVIIRREHLKASHEHG